MSLSLPDLRATLPAALVADVPDDVLGDVLAAERGQQATTTRSPDPRPPALDDALVARVRFNLDQTAPAEVGDVVRCGSRSPEVRALEAPYSSRVAAADRGQPPAPPAAPRPRKRTAKRATKKAAKKAATKTAPATPAGGTKAGPPASTEGN